VEAFDRLRAALQYRSPIRSGGPAGARMQELSTHAIAGRQSSASMPRGFVRDIRALGIGRVVGVSDDEVARQALVVPDNVWRNAHQLPRSPPG
jgi:hypothetical protein